MNKTIKYVLFVALAFSTLLLPALPVSAVCKLTGPITRIDLPRGLPPWTKKEVQNIAGLALAEKPIDAVWRWNNMMANSPFNELEKSKKVQLGNAVLTLTRIGMEKKYDTARERVRFYRQIEELLLQAELEADRAMMRLEYARPHRGEDEAIAAFPRVVGIPRPHFAGPPPVLITQIHLMDFQALKDYKENLADRRHQVAEMTTKGLQDLLQPDKSLEGLMASLGELESAIRQSYFTHAGKQ